MKKIFLILIITLLLSGCTENNEELKEFLSYLDNIKLDISLTVKEGVVLDKFLGYFNNIYEKIDEITFSKDDYSMAIKNVGKVTMDSLLTPAIMCNDGGGKLNSAVVGNEMCSDNTAYFGVWPTAPVGFIWGTVIDFRANDGLFQYIATTDTGEVTIICNENGCN